jgi:hypothetical protein
LQEKVALVACKDIQFLLTFVGEGLDKLDRLDKLDKLDRRTGGQADKRTSWTRGQGYFVILFFLCVFFVIGYFFFSLFF